MLVTLGDHLKKRRLELGLFQKDVAQRLGINEWTYLNWEKNYCDPIVSMWPRIIDFLGYYPFTAPQTPGRRLLVKRRSLGLSQKLMAKRLSVDEATLARWEMGTVSPTGEQFPRITQVRS